jgi:zinc finger protein
MPAEKITATLKDQPCPVCNQKKLALTEAETEVPYFGKLFVFSMTCENCKYHKSDVEAAEQREPCKYVFEVSGKEDLQIRVIKSSEATVKFERVGSIEPGPASEGYVTNVEGLIQRIKEQIEKVRDLEEDEDAKKKAKNLVKRLQNVLWGSERLKLTLEDPSGNSAIISEKAKRSKL